MSTLPNWIDLVIVICIWRVGYVGLAHGMWAELLSLVAAFAVTVLSVNYWPVLFNVVQPYIGTLRQADFVLFLVVLLLLTLATSVTLRQLLSKFQTQTHDWLYYGIGLVLGVVRGFWLAGFCLIVLSGSGWPYAQASIQQASFGSRVEVTVEQAMAAVCRHMPGFHANSDQFVPSAMY